MKKGVLAALAALACMATPAYAETISGEYVEARTCDVWTGACFANSDANFAGKHAVLAWRVEQGEWDGVSLNGLSVLAVVEATNTLGMQQSGPAKAAVIVDQRADAHQRQALVKLARRLGGELIQNIVRVDAAEISLSVNHCPKGGCAKVCGGAVRVETRCFRDDEDKACGHEENYYPPLSSEVKVDAAFVREHTYTGQAFGKTWCDAARRGGYVGKFAVNLAAKNPQ